MARNVTLQNKLSTLNKSSSQFSQNFIFPRIFLLFSFITKDIFLCSFTATALAPRHDLFELLHVDGRPEVWMEDSRLFECLHATL
jgi:hypothetical protein